MDSSATTSSAESAHKVLVPSREGFLWGAATAAHQVEGNNIANDWWHLEHSGSEVIAEPSGDAADHFHRWPEDLDLLASLGLNAYRFSLEWSRIEPEKGFFSNAAIEHYRKMVAGCLVRGLAPIVTLHHVTLPLWFRRQGGWSSPEAAELFARFTTKVLPALEGVEWVCTINEPGMQPMISRLHAGDPEALKAWTGGGMPVPTPREIDELISAHHSATEILHAETDAKVGWTVSIADLQYDDAGRVHADAWFEKYEGPFLRASRGDDFIGIQNYFRTVFDKDGVVPLPSGARMTDIWEFYPEALGNSLRVAWETTDHTPILVTENGIPTNDDTLRVEFMDRALTSLTGAMNDGVDVRGYLHWSALDNFEWALGYGPRFGLIEVDPVTFERRLKPSAHHYAALVTQATSVHPQL
ncbi:MAG TPA: family 1 glycosylhydrolase [Pseudolysinimonas sp.]|nr:family 1 glycosylhydrolase [Pseudolysinimonas sp.]